ncbi:hypothetical protein [Pseudacidovorax intermedius]|uniref:hypothetical protein n=1 Tax=Pseudacidovorax intermedius TaxID=433924 RepID=UPI0026EE3AEA|nr:hypothetical protein [Pseudacidovorax intermedius]
MSFEKRALQVTFRLADMKFTNGADQIDLSGYRVEVEVDNPGGFLSMAGLQMRIFGMALSDMNTLSTDGRGILGIRNDQLAVSAGDEGNPLSQVFDGTIGTAFIDYESAPEVPLIVIARTGILWQAKPVSPNSYRGPVDAAKLVGDLAGAMGYAFRNHGISGLMVTNPYLPGTLVDQIYAVARAVGVSVSISNGTVEIWPNGGRSEGAVIEIGPETGLIGYPSFTPTGIRIRSQFVPALTAGRVVNLTTSVTRSQGEWVVQSVRHRLSSMAPKGPWFSECFLVKEGLYVPRN